ncbi:hypothetical protein [Emticicia sp. W12TSBA100-4]|uniref:hypothetical protein n=1 Tax=Emticicia sp. W12TSBA100-4 TaxID=3160965 RepID=UPI0033062CE4
MKELVENLLNDKRKKRARGKLAEALGISYTGLQHKMTFDTFNENDIPILESFFEVEKGYFNNNAKPVKESKIEISMWELAKEQYERRVDELTAALNDARYTIQLQRKMLEQNPFKVLSKKPPVKRAYMAGMYVSQKSLMRA